VSGHLSRKAEAGRALSLTSPFGSGLYSAPCAVTLEAALFLRQTYLARDDTDGGRCKEAPRRLESAVYRTPKAIE